MASMKEATAKKEEKLAELLTTAEGHPMMKAILAEEAAKVLAKRTEAVGKIEVLKKEQAEVIPRLLEDRDAKEENFKRAKAALKTAGGEYQTARVAVSSRSQSFDHAIGRQEQILFESADPAIDEAITFFRDKLDYLRAPGRLSRNAIGSEINLISWKKKTFEESNVQAVHDAMRYCQAAILELERMKLSPELDRVRIEGMKAGVPKIDVYTEFTGEKPLEKVNTDPLSMLPSASQIDWEIGKLKEKVKKVLGR